MKRLATVGAVLILFSSAIAAGPIEFYFSGGPSAAALTDIQAIVDRLNAIIAELNDTIATLPDIVGEVQPIDAIGGQVAYQAGERYWFGERLALGAKLEGFRVFTSTQGAYASSEASEISVDLNCYAVGLLAGARYDFLSVNLLLSGDLGFGYYYSAFDRAVTFQIPPEYPTAISGLPPEGSARYSALAPGIMAGLSLHFPITDWLAVGSSLFYRSLVIGGMSDSEGVSMDLDGDGTAEKVDLSGITVQVTFSLAFDLSPQREKE